MSLMDKLITEAEKAPQRGEYRLADILKAYADVLMLKFTDGRYRIIPTDGWEPSQYNTERQYLMPYKDDLIRILATL